jgi:hypothetical protein
MAEFFDGLWRNRWQNPDVGAKLAAGSDVPSGKSGIR